jgi:hypothetical protein
MIMVVKQFGTYVSPGNLGPSLRKVHYFFGKLPFSLRIFLIHSRSYFSRYFICSFMNFFAPLQLHFRPWETYLHCFLGQLAWD